MEESLGLDRIELVETYVRIVESGSLTAAAAQLGTTQPTVSRRLKSLEGWLGVRLLQRSTHHMQLTEEGERLLGRARELLQAWWAMEEELRSAREGPSGLLRVVVPHAFGQGALVAPLIEYLRAYPEVSVEWLLHDRDPDFVADGVDCAIHLGPVTDPSLVALQLAEVPRVAVAAPELGGGAVEELHRLPWVALGAYYRDEVVLLKEGAEELVRIPIRPRFLTDSVYALRSATLAGLGASLISAWLVTEDLAAGRLRELAPGWRGTALPVSLVYPYSRFYPARLRRFVELMKQRMPAIAGVRPPARR